MMRSFAAVSVFALLMAAFAVPFVMAQSEPREAVVAQAS